MLSIENLKAAFKSFFESNECLKERGGYGAAQNWIGFCYKNGYGVVTDLAQAIAYFKLSAEQGHANAEYNLGSCFMRGEGVVKNQAEGAKFYRKAAE